MAENYCKKFHELPTIPVTKITTEELATRMFYWYMCMHSQMQEMHAAVKKAAPDFKFSPEVESMMTQTASGDPECCCGGPVAPFCPPWCIACEDGA